MFKKELYNWQWLIIAILIWALFFGVAFYPMHTLGVIIWGFIIYRKSFYFMGKVLALYSAGRIIRAISRDKINEITDEDKNRVI